MSFKENMLADLNNVFFDATEFADEHVLQGEKIILFIEEEKAEDYKSARQTLYTNGIYAQSKIIYVRKSTLSFEPFKDQIVTLDGDAYTIKWITCPEGCYVIGLEANES